MKRREFLAATFLAPFAPKVAIEACEAPPPEVFLYAGSFELNLVEAYRSVSLPWRKELTVWRLEIGPGEDDCGS